MIENFELQPFPLECSADGETWMLVVGWRQRADTLAPVIAAPAGGTVTYFDDEGRVTYRLADTRPVAPRPTAAPSARVEPRRERGA